jgi:3'(2'), 5'-bisphosphate nucleotidase
MRQELGKIFETIPSDKQIIGLLNRVSNKILPEYNKIEQGVVYKSDNSPQALADRISSEMILEWLGKNTPFPVLSEEVDYGRDFKSETFWITDPLDGTRDFLNKTGEFAIMLALVNNKEPIFGTVYHPLTEMCYMAKKGKGTFLVDEDGSSLRLHVSKTSDIHQMRMVTSRFHTKGTDLEVAKRLKVKDLIEHGSFGLKVGLIAEGSAEIYLNSSNRTSIWDSAPNIVILTEAGGRITDLNGGELLIDPAKKSNENGIVATNGQNHFEITRQIREIVNQIK